MGRSRSTGGVSDGDAQESTNLGAEHPSTLTSTNNLAFTWKENGRDGEALKLIEECAAARSRILGTNHPDTLPSRTTLLGWQTEEIGTLIGKDLDE